MQYPELIASVNESKVIHNLFGNSSLELEYLWLTILKTVQYFIIDDDSGQSYSEVGLVACCRRLFKAEMAALVGQVCVCLSVAVAHSNFVLLQVIESGILDDVDFITLEFTIKMCFMKLCDAIMRNCSAEFRVGFGPSVLIWCGEMLDASDEIILLLVLELMYILLQDGVFIPDACLVALESLTMTETTGAVETVGRAIIGFQRSS
jgi:hypothetical protein